MGWLDGKVAYISGGSSGIGKAVAERFVAEGAKVCVLGTSEQKLAQLQQELGENAATVQGDVRIYADHERAVRVACETFGKLDIFVGNAGVFDGHVRLADVPPENLEEAFDQMFHINVKGYLYGAKAAIPELRKSHGNIVFTLSEASFYSGGGGTLYTGSKHACLGILKRLAFELAPEIRVNAVAPGGTTSQVQVIAPLREFSRSPGSAEVRNELIRKGNPLQIAAEPGDHAAAYVLLASDQSKAITGVVIQSDGGVGVRGKNF